MENHTKEDIKDIQPEDHESGNTSGQDVLPTEPQQADETNSENWELKFNEANDKYLRLYSEFDNYRKRTMKERAELIRTAGEDILKTIIPVMDDFERAIKANENAVDVVAIKEGLKLIHHKLITTTQHKGLVAFESMSKMFDSDLMEAVTHLPAENPEQIGKVIDEIEKGYKLGEKVIRYAKVVVAQ